jgi:hypothetical protein
VSVEQLRVRLRQFPVELWMRATEHSDALQREFTLMSSPATDDTHVPRRLLDLVAALRAQYSTATTAQQELLFAAAAAGTAVLDEVVYVVPPAAGAAGAALSALYDEADEYCRQGRHLLTLATPPELVAFRRWFLGEFVAQAAGSAPTPWPQYRDAVAAGG